MEDYDNLFDMIVDYFDLRYSNRKEYSMGTAVSIMSCLTGTAVRTDESCPINTSALTYVALLGDSNTGKSTVISFGENLLKQINYTNIISNDITVEDFVPYLKEHRHALMRAGEFSSLLSSYRIKAYMSGLREKLILVYDGAPLVQSRTSRGNVTVKEHCMNLLTDTQPEVIRNSVKTDDIASGLIPRFIWFVFDEHDIDHQPPKVLSGQGKELKDQIVEYMNILYQTSRGRHINYKFTQEQVNKIYVFCVNKTAFNPMFDPIYARIVQIVYKMTMLREFGSLNHIQELQSMRKSAGTERYIGDEDVEEVPVILKDSTIDISNESIDWALKFTKNYVEDVLPVVINTIALKDVDRIRSIVKYYKNERSQKWMPASILLRRAQMINEDPRIIEKIIAFALKIGYIKSKKFNAGTSYRYVDDEELGKDEDVLHKEIESYEKGQVQKTVDDFHIGDDEDEL